MIKEILTASPLDFDIIITSRSGEDYILGSVQTLRKLNTENIEFILTIDKIKVKKMIFENDNGKPGKLLITETLKK